MQWHRERCQVNLRAHAVCGGGEGLLSIIKQQWRHSLVRRILGLCVYWRDPYNRVLSSQPVYLMLFVCGANGMDLY